jgi:hypothetical protein
MQLRLIEQQNKKRLMIARQKTEQEQRSARQKRNGEEVLHGRGVTGRTDQSYGAPKDANNLSSDKRPFHPMTPFLALVMGDLTLARRHGQVNTKRGTRIKMAMCRRRTTRQVTRGSDCRPR